MTFPYLELEDVRKHKFRSKNDSRPRHTAS